MVHTYISGGIGCGSALLPISPCITELPDLLGAVLAVPKTGYVPSVAQQDEREQLVQSVTEF